MSTISRPRGSFGVQKKDVPGVQVRAQAMHDGITANAATFSSPTITMVVFVGLITALAEAQQNAVGTKAKGSASVRDTKRNEVWTAMDLLRAYVQSLADALNADAAASLIESAGLVVASTGGHQKAALTATLTTSPGVVHLDANAALLVGPADAAKKVTFHWAWSGDAGKTWNDVRSTPYANTDIPGLAPMSTYSFRASVTIGKITGAWSQAVSLLVL
jgi:hypothetical protein